MSIPTHGETYMKLMDHLRQAQECSATLSHLANTEDGTKAKALSKSWMVVSELFKHVQLKVTELAQGRLN